MKKLLIIFNLIIILISISCNTNHLSKEDKTEIDLKNEELITLRENTFQDLDSIVLINNSEEYYKITNKINETRMPGINFKDVDFDSNSVILINVVMDNYSDIEIYSKTNSEKTTLFYSGIHYKNNQIPSKNIRLIKLIEIPKTKKIESFRPMH